MLQEAVMPKARFQTIKGTNYVYLETSHRVPGRNYPDHKRTYFGKMADGNFIPNVKLHALTPAEQQASGLDWEAAAEPEKPRGRPIALVGIRKFRGLDLLLSTVCREIGLDRDLAKIFGERTPKMLSIAYYLISNPDAALYRFSSWARLRFHPHGQDISSPRSSELFGSITEDEIQQFLHLRLQRSLGASGWLVVDTTSISSFSQGLSLVTKGRNKDHDHLDQINLLMVFDQDADIPVFYRTLRGNITDVTTVEHALHDLQGIGIETASLVLDRGFYSQDNVIHLLKKRYAFTLGTKISLAFVKEAIAEVREQMMSPTSYDEQRRVFQAVVPITFSVPVRGRGPNERTAYLHLYCSKEKEADDTAALMERLKDLRLQLESGKVTASKRELETFFTLTRNNKDEITAFTENQQAIAAALSRCGFFALLTSEKQLDSRQVLSIYRKKDKVEKSFGNLKDRLSLRRTRCSRDDNFEGKVLVQFIALMVASHIRKVMSELQLYARYSYRQLLDEVDVIEYFEYRNRAGHWGEITEKQGDILQDFTAELPIEAWPKEIQKKLASKKKN